MTQLKQLVDVCNTLNNLKDQARNTNDQPCQIIQSCVTNMPSTAHPHMPNRNVLRQQIKRVRRKNTPSQRQSLGDLTILDSLRTTIGGGVIFN